MLRKVGTAIGLFLFLLALPVGGGTSVEGQTSPPSPEGHWEGAILVPGEELGINIDLVRTENGWAGDISIPAQDTEDFPLADVTVAGLSVSFRMAEVPGNPSFQGNLSEDGTTITGRFSQGGATLQFRLTRVDEDV